MRSSKTQRPKHHKILKWRPWAFGNYTIYHAPWKQQLVGHPVCIIQDAWKTWRQHKRSAYQYHYQRSQTTHTDSWNLCINVACLSLFWYKFIGESSEKSRMVTYLFSCFVNEILLSSSYKKSKKFLEDNMLGHATLNIDSKCNMGKWQDVCRPNGTSWCT